MLEHPSLLIHDWQSLTSPDGATRSIAAAAWQPLGFVRFAAEQGTPWFSWLRSVRLELFETDDASHLMTVSRSWGILGAWEVYDADDRHVGIIHPKTMMTGERQRLGFLDFESAEKGRVLDPTGQLLAAYARRSDVVLELTFTPQPTVNPFLRMMILASVLTLRPTP